MNSSADFTKGLRKRALIWRDVKIYPNPLIALTLGIPQNLAMAAPYNAGFNATLCTSDGLNFLNAISKSKIVLISMKGFKLPRLNLTNKLFMSAIFDLFFFKNSVVATATSNPDDWA